MKKNNFWSGSTIVLLFCLLFTPIIVASSLYFPYVTGKVFAFRFIVAAAFISWLVLVVRRPEYLPKKSAILATSGLFVVWMAISNLFGIDSYNSFFSNFERMEGWFTHLFMFLYLLVASSVLKTDRIWNWFLGTSLLVANVIALIAAFDDVSRTNAILGNSTYLAIYSLFNLYFAALLGFRLLRKRMREHLFRYVGLAYYALSIILLTYAIFRTQTRGTVLALVFSGLFFMLLSAISHWKNKKVRIVTIILIALTIIGGILFWVHRDSAFIQGNPMLARITTISTTEGTGRARIVNWSIAVESIKDRPIMGWGQENFMYAFAMFYNPQMYNQEAWFDRTHNAFLDWTVQGGVPALVFYILLFIIPLYVIHGSSSFSRTEKNLLISLFAAYTIHNLFVFDNYSSYLMFFTTLAFVVHNHQKKEVVLDAEERTMQMLAVVLVCATVIVSYVVIVKPYQVARAMISVYKTQDAEVILSSYEKIFAKNTFGTFEAVTRFLSDAPNFLKVNDPEFQKRYMIAAQRAGEKSVADAPQSVRALEFYGNFLLMTGNTKEAIVVLERAREISPDRQNNLYVLGFAYVNDGQYDKGLEIFKHAYEVAPENLKAKNYYGGALLLAGDKTGDEFVGGYLHTDPFLLSVFAKTGRYKEVVNMLEQQVAEQPTNYQLRVSLATAHLKAGNRAKSVEIMRTVIANVPAFKEQGEYFIKEVLAGRNPAK